MFYRSTFLLAVSFAAASASAQLVTARPVSSLFTEFQSNYSQTRILVKVVSGKEKNATTAYTKSKLKVIRTIPKLGWQTLQLPKGTTPEVAISKLKGNSAFAKISKSWVYTADATPTDPLFGQQYGAQLMQFPAAWDLAPAAGEGVIIAILDTGVDKTHPELAARMVPGYDFGDNDNNPQDDEGHGTHVAGIAAAAANNGIGIAGNAYAANIMPVRVLGGEFGGFNDAIAAGIRFAVDNGASVLNMSLGGYPTEEDPILLDAVQYAKDAGVLIVASAGNLGQDNGQIYHSPGDIEDILNVGASDSGDQRAGFSNYGDPVDVAAPGDTIMSLVPGGGYGFNSGTSMAAPQVAGLAAVVVGRVGVGALTHSELRNIIESTCDPIGNWITYGRVNANEALLATGTAIADTPVAETPVPMDGTVTVSAGALGSTDGISATIRSMNRKGVGLTGSASTAFGLSTMTASEVTKATMTLNVSADAVATVQVFFQDLSGKWVLYTTQPGNPAGRTTTFKLTRATVAKYMQNEKINVLVRSLVPTRLASRARGVTNVDLLSFTFSGTRLITNPSP